MATCIFIFRRDLRIIDNHAFEEMLIYCKQNKIKQVLPIFIFRKEQVEPKLNPYYSSMCIRFMVECLKELDIELNKRLGHGLNVFEVSDGKGEVSLLKELIKKHDVTAMFFNRDLTPYAIRRDEEIGKMCEELKLHCPDLWTDYTLFDVTQMPKGYRVYGPFLKKYIDVPVPKPIDRNNITGIKALKAECKGELKRSSWDKYYSKGISSRFQGGRKHALNRMEYLNDNKSVFQKYEVNRNFPFLDEKSTTLLSAYMKFGCVSIREVYWFLRDTFGAGNGIIREVYWRTFYDQMVYWWGETLDRQLDVKKRVNQAWFPAKDGRWARDQDKLMDIVTNAKTGIPIVDASVTCVLKTGYLHNRLRMVLCMVACRILRIDWRLMEEWFASVLVDYHPASNRGGWEWALTYQYVLNPWVQQEKFDTDCAFVKKWLPVLRDIDAKVIHQWYDNFKSARFDGVYWAPILSRKLEKMCKP